MESEKEASDGEDEDDDNVDTVRKRLKRNNVTLFSSFVLRCPKLSSDR